MSIRCGSDSPSLSPGLPRPDAHRPGRIPQAFPPLCFASPASSSECTSPARIPANLHACHESRREALRRYRLCFGTARRPGRVFFDPERDVLYFGPRDGFMASEAQLRTVLTLCDPAELAAVRRAAVNDALFWVYSGAGGAAGGGGGGAGREVGGDGGDLDGAGESGAMAATRTTVASSLLVDVLQLARARLTGLRELVFVPRDENPVYSADCCLVEPAIIQNRLARQVREAMGAVFDGGPAPWAWRVMTLSADPSPPVYGRAVLGWDEEPGRVHAGTHGRLGRGVGAGAGAAAVREVGARAKGRRAGGELGALQESVRRRFMRMEVGVCR